MRFSPCDDNCWCAIFTRSHSLYRSFTLLAQPKPLPETPYTTPHQRRKPIFVGMFMYRPPSHKICITKTTFGSETYQKLNLQPPRSPPSTRHPLQPLRLLPREIKVNLRPQNIRHGRQKATERKVRILIRHLLLGKPTHKAHLARDHHRITQGWDRKTGKST